MTRWLALAAVVGLLPACNKPAAPPAPVNTAGPPPAPAPADGAVSVQELTPLGAAEVTALLSSAHRFRFPDVNNRFNPHTLEFDGQGRVVDGSCDPAACEGGYAVANDIVIMHLYDRVARLHFYRSAAGNIYATRGIDGETLAFPW